MSWYEICALIITVTTAYSFLLKTHRTLRSHGQNRLVSAYFLMSTRKIISYHKHSRIIIQGALPNKLLYWYIRANGWKVTIL